MLSLKINNTEIGLKFSFLVVLLLVSLSQKSQYLLLALIACLLHECGHIIAMCIFEVPPKQVIFYGAGIKIVSNISLISSKYKEIIILFSGCATNFLLFFVMYFCIDGGFIYKLYAIMNLLIGLFNLIPIRHFDGGQILSAIFFSCKSDRLFTIGKILRIVLIMSLVIVSFILFSLSYINISILIAFIYVIISELFM